MPLKLKKSKLLSDSENEDIKINKIKLSDSENDDIDIKTPNYQ